MVNKVVASLEAPDDIKVSLDALCNLTDLFFNDQLVGVYLHGSLAMGGFNPHSSDMDLIIVLAERIDPAVVMEFVFLITDNAASVPFWNFELTILIQETQVPELSLPKFGVTLLCSGDPSEVDILITPNPDLPSHHAMVHARGVCFFGRPIDEVFVSISRASLLASIGSELRVSYKNVMDANDDGKTLVPCYAVLNFCRALAYAREEKLLSKIEGADWALQHLPDEYHFLIQQARAEKLSTQSSQLIDPVNLKKFVGESMCEFAEIGLPEMEGNAAARLSLDKLAAMAGENLLLLRGMPVDKQDEVTLSWYLSEIQAVLRKYL